MAASTLPVSSMLTMSLDDITAQASKARRQTRPYVLLVAWWGGSETRARRPR